MVKVFGPAMSLDASGSLANAITYSKWKGRNYVRERVIPANPKSAQQTSVRAMFKMLSQHWTTVTVADKATWLARATALVASNFNAYMSYNMTRWRNWLPPSTEDPAVGGGVGSNLNWTAATGGIRMATLAINVVAGNDGWGVIIARSTTTGFTPGLSNVIAVHPCIGGGDHDYVDTPLNAGTYYYRMLQFMLPGEFHAAWIAEESAVVTDA